MRVGILNNRYFRSGGPENYLFGVKELLEQRGHKVIPLAVAYAQSEASEYSSYFVPPPSSDRSAVYHHDMRLSLVEKLRLAGRSIYSIEARRLTRRLFSEHPVDVAYALQVGNMLSPSVLDACAGLGIPVVMRVSDYHLACASYLHLRDGQICRACLQSRLNAIRYRCVKGSLALTTVRVAGMAVHDMTHVYQRVQAVVAPSLTMLEELAEIGFPREKLHHVPTFVDLGRFEPSYRTSGPILYLGRLSPEKGVDCLIRAYAQLPLVERPGLHIVGPETAPGELALLQDLARSLGVEDVKFTGKLEGPTLTKVLAGAFAVVVPSRWLENSPNTLFEAMASGKPVIGSSVGSIAEQIADGFNGYTFPVDDPAGLADRMLRLLRAPENAARLGRNARRQVEERNAPEHHVSTLLSLFEQLAARAP